MGCGASSPTAAVEVAPAAKAPAAGTAPSTTSAPTEEAPAIKAIEETPRAVEEVPVPPAVPEKPEDVKADAHVAPAEPGQADAQPPEATQPSDVPDAPDAPLTRMTSVPLPPLLPPRAASRTALPDSGTAEADGDSSRPHAHFGGVPGADADEEAMPERPAMLSLKSSRSLNRSFGVKRRTSDADSLGPGMPEPAAAAKEEEEDQEPDPLREQFERNKDSNPLLSRKTTANGMSNAISARNSEKSIRSSKRPSVGFILAGEGEDEPAAAPSRNASRLGSRVGSQGDETDRDEVDPESHWEAERVASILPPREELAAPVTARHSGGGAEGGAPLVPLVPVAAG